MADYSAQSAPPTAKRKFPIWIVIAVVAVMLLCGIGLCVALSPVLGPAISGASAGSQLPTICMERTGLDSQTCSTWTQGVTNSPAFQTCLQQGLENDNLTGDQLYDCLDAEGAGPED